MVPWPLNGLLRLVGFGVVFAEFEIICGFSEERGALFFFFWGGVPSKGLYSMLLGYIRGTHRGTHIFGSHHLELAPKSYAL